MSTPKVQLPMTAAQFAANVGSQFKLVPKLDLGNGDQLDVVLEREIFDLSTAYRPLNPDGRPVLDLSVYRCRSNRSMIDLFTREGTSLPDHIISHNATCSICTNYLGGKLGLN